MPVKYRRDSDEERAPVRRDWTRRLTPWQRQQAKGNGDGALRWRMVMLYLAAFGVVLLLYGGALLGRAVAPEGEAGTGEGEVVRKGPVEEEEGEPLGTVDIRFPIGERDPVTAVWSVPAPLWEDLHVGDRVAVRYERDGAGAWRLLDAGYIALPHGD